MKQPVKILFIIDTLGRGGAETLLLTICRYLRQHYPALSISVLCCYEKGLLEQDFLKLEIPVKCAYVKNTSIFRRFLRMYLYVKRQNPTAVHTHLLFSDRYGLPAAFLAGVKTRISTIHGIEQNRDMQDRITRWLTSVFATWIVAVSKNAQSYFSESRTYPSEKSLVINNACNDNFKQVVPKTSNGLETVELISVGRLVGLKNHQCLIEAMRLLSERKNTLFNLNIYGAGEKEGLLISKISGYGLGNVRLKGLIEHDRLPSVLRHADILVSASYSEGFPVSVIEAMSAGLPVIISDIGSHRELFTEPDSYDYFFQPDDYQTLADKIILLSGAERYNKAAKICHEESSRFSVAAMVKRYMELYRRQ